MPGTGTKRSAMRLRSWGLVRWPNSVAREVRDIPRLRLNSKAPGQFSLTPSTIVHTLDLTTGMRPAGPSAGVPDYVSTPRLADRLTAPKPHLRQAGSGLLRVGASMLSPTPSQVSHRARRRRAKRVMVEECVCVLVYMCTNTHAQYMYMMHIRNTRPYTQIYWPAGLVGGYGGYGEAAAAAVSRCRGETVTAQAVARRKGRGPQAPDNKPPTTTKQTTHIGLLGAMRTTMVLCRDRTADLASPVIKVLTDHTA